MFLFVFGFGFVCGFLSETVENNGFDLKTQRCAIFTITFKQMHHQT